MYDIFTYIWLIFMVSVGKYTSPMDGMGNFNQSFKSITHIHSERTKAAGQRFDLQDHGASNAQPQFVVGQVATQEKTMPS